MLDEPTNHLDIHSVDLLVEALNKYEGSLILVSHDRYFISRIANKIWEIDEHKIREFKGTYAEWEDWKERKEKTAVTSAQAETKAVKKEIKSEKPAVQPSINNDQKRELEKLKKKFKQLEDKLQEINKAKSLLENKLANPEVYGNKDSFLEVETAYKKASMEADQINVEYEKLFEEIMVFESGT
jgi:ATP-binding cassette subfamily F protein 3